MGNQSSLDYTATPVSPGAADLAGRTSIIAELTTKPQLASIFMFAELPRPLKSPHLLFEPRWYIVTNDQSRIMLGE